MLTYALNSPITYLISLLLAIAAYTYAYRIVRPLRRRNPDHGQTAWLVVVGVAGVNAAYMIILAFIAGMVAALEHGVLLLLLFTIAGAPMIAEYVADHTRTVARDVLSQISNIFQEE